MLFRCHKLTTFCLLFCSLSLSVYRAFAFHHPHQASTSVQKYLFTIRKDLEEKKVSWSWFCCCCLFWIFITEKTPILAFAVRREIVYAELVVSGVGEFFIFRKEAWKKGFLLIYNIKYSYIFYRSTKRWNENDLADVGDAVTQRFLSDETWHQMF